MRTFFIVLLCLVVGDMQSQITCDFTLTTNTTNLVPVYLTPQNFKYIEYDTNAKPDHFLLLTADGTVYKTILYPENVNDLALGSVPFFVSTTLFDNDSTTIEFVVSYTWYGNLGPRFHIKIAREDGTVLLNEPDAFLPNVNIPELGGEAIIFQTPGGLKLQLVYQFESYIPYQIKVFSLPGGLPKAPNSIELDYENMLTLFPNPNSGVFHVGDFPVDQPYRLELYTNKGQLIRYYEGLSRQVDISTTGLDVGLYFLTIKDSRGKVLNRKKVLIQK